MEYLKKYKFAIIFLILGFVSIFILGLSREYCILFHTAIQYNQGSQIDEKIVKGYDITNYGLLTGMVKVQKESVFRLEFDGEKVKNKLIVFDNIGTGKIEGYFITPTPQFNEFSWLIMENCLSVRDSFHCRRNILKMKTLFSLFSHERIERKELTNLSNTTIFNDESFMQAVIRDFDSLYYLYEIVVSSVIFRYNLLNNTTEGGNDGGFYTRHYSTESLTNGINQIVFSPNDLLENPEKIGFLLYLSGGTTVSYHFEDNPLIKKDAEWLGIRTKSDSIQGEYFYAQGENTQQACEESLKGLSSEKITDEITIIPGCTTIQKDETNKTYVAGYFYTYHFNDFGLTLETSNYTDIFQTKRETPFFVISGNKLLFLDPANNNLSAENYYLERYEKEINENLEDIITKKHLGKECIIMKEENEDDLLSGIYQNEYYLIMQDPSIRDNAEKPREIQGKCISDPESNGNALFFESQDRTHYYKYVSTDGACFPNACHPIEKIEVL